MCIELLGVLLLIFAPRVNSMLGYRRVPVLHTYKDGICPSRCPLSLSVLIFGCWLDSEVVHVLPCKPSSLRWLSWTMWAFSCSWMRNIVLVWGVSGLFIPNRAFSFDTNDCRARVLILSSFRSGRFTCGAGIENECYLVDPASSHMLVSKIKPCMCKYEQIQTVKLRMAH